MHQNSIKSNQFYAIASLLGVKVTFSVRSSEVPSDGTWPVITALSGQSGIEITVGGGGLYFREKSYGAWDQWYSK